MSDWDKPFAYEFIVRANAALGRMDKARTARDHAKDPAQNVADDGDRDVLIQEMQREPCFGLRGVSPYRCSPLLSDFEGFRRVGSKICLQKLLRFG